MSDKSDNWAGEYRQGPLLYQYRHKSSGGKIQYKNRRCGMIVHETATHQVTIEF